MICGAGHGGRELVCAAPVLAGAGGYNGDELGRYAPLPTGAGYNGDKMMHFAPAPAGAGV